MANDDERTIHDLLRRECPGVQVRSVSPLERGYTSRQWVADTDQGRLLVKVPQRNRATDHLRRLVSSAQVAAEHGVPVVRYRTLVLHDAALGGPALVQEYQEGDAVGDVWETLDEGERMVLVEDLGELVGRLHSVTGPYFGDVLGRRKASSLREATQTELEGLIARADLGAVGDADALRSAVADALAGLTDSAADVPALTHGDLWWPNFLVRDGRISCVLDFEHALYAERFRDFGKLDEHIFDHFPAGRPVFVKAYAAACPLPRDWDRRVDLGNVLHALTMHVYFRRWDPRWAPQYAEQVRRWLAGKP